MPQHNNENNTNNEELSLKELILKIREWWRFLLLRWKVILVASIIGGVVGILYSLSQKPVYRAELSFAIQDEKGVGGLSGALGLASQFGLDLGNSPSGEFSGDNLLVLMQSRSMIERALLTTVIVNGEKKTLAELYISFNEIRKGWEKDPKLKKIYFLPEADRSKFDLQQDSVLGAFHKSLIKSNVIVDKLDKKLSIITLVVKSKNELFSKYFAEVLAKVVSDFYIQTKTKKEVHNVAILQRQTDSVRRALNAAISGVASSLDAAPNPNPSLLTLRVPSQRRQIDVQANTAILGELVKNLELSKMSLLQETPLIQIIDKPILPLDKERVGRIRSALAIGVLFGFITCIILIVKECLKRIMY